PTKRRVPMELLSFSSLSLGARTAVAVDAVAELFSDLERGRLPGRDLDGLTSARVAAAARGALANGEGAEAAEVDALTAGQPLGHRIEECVDRLLDLWPRNVLPLGHQIHQVGFFHRSRRLLVSLTPIHTRFRTARALDAGSR